MKTKLWGLVFVALLTGCAPKGLPRPPSWSESANSGELVIYREGSFFSGARNAYFYVNGVHVASVPSGAYTVIALPPDSYKVTQKWDWDKLMKEKSIDVRVHPRQRTFARLRLTDGMYLAGVSQEMWALEEMAAGRGEEEILKLEAMPPMNPASN